MNLLYFKLKMGFPFVKGRKCCVLHFPYPAQIMHQKLKMLQKCNTYFC